MVDVNNMDSSTGTILKADFKLMIEAVKVYVGSPLTKVYIRKDKIKLPQYISYDKYKEMLSRWKLFVDNQGVEPTFISINKPTYKPVVLTTDIIQDTPTDNMRMNTIKQALNDKGIPCIIYGIGPNTSNEAITAKYTLDGIPIPKDCLVVNMFGGTAAGVIEEMGERWFKYYLGDKTIFLVYFDTIVDGKHKCTDITGLDWLPRDAQDNYSPASFTGIANPVQYLRDNGYDYIYSNDLKAISEAIIKHALI
jgi:hypothetical protein